MNLVQNVFVIYPVHFCAKKIFIFFKKSPHKNIIKEKV